MAWINSVGRDISHHNPITNYAAARASTDWWQIKITESTNFTDDMAATHYRGLAGDPRGAYHFARPVSLPDQIALFLRRKREIGSWERLDMLDCEFPGVNGEFIKRLVAEYRRASGIRRVLVYCGQADLRGACAPSMWWDSDTPIWAARYRKIGPPAGPDAWQQHLQWDHVGLAIYQWDNANPLPGGGLTDINAERTRVTADTEEDDMTPEQWAVIQKMDSRIKSMHGNGFNEVAIGEERSLQGNLNWVQEQIQGSKLAADVAELKSRDQLNAVQVAAALAPLLQQETGAVTPALLNAAVDTLLQSLPPAVLQLLKSKL